MNMWLTDKFKTLKCSAAFQMHFKSILMLEKASSTFEG